MRKRDWLVLALIVFAAATHAYLTVDFSLAPAEDAAMLMRYARHVADGHGIVWNVGEPPIDGATDFLFMIAIAALVKLGISLELATRALILSAHALSAGIVFVAVREIGRAPTLAALASGVYLILGPATAYIGTYFGAPVFALCAAAAWTCALAIANGPTNRALPAAFACFSLLTGLVRPEGVILASLMLVSIVVAAGLKASRPAIVWFVATFATLGLAYFFWRWHYFGHPLPNPFYKKGGGALHFSGLKDSVFNTVKFTLPLLPLYAIGLFSRATLRRTIAVAIPMVGFAACFISISSEMNFAGRFQYVLLPMALMAWPVPLNRIIDYAASATTPMRRRAISAAGTIFFFASVAYMQVWRGDWAHYPDGRAAMGKMLREHKDKDLRLATSEAGLLPLYSEWRTLDAWGLNDFTIATHGTITSDYLSAFDPDLIVFHAYDPPFAEGTSGLPGWAEMANVLRSYVAQHGFVLAAAFGDSPHDLHYYYVHPRIAQEFGVADRIRHVAYRWPGNGNLATNFALTEMR
jgi:hypothetical protein